jgi:hypothetical protein
MGREHRTRGLRQPPAGSSRRHPVPVRGRGSGPASWTSRSPEPGAHSPWQWHTSPPPPPPPPGPWAWALDPGGAGARGCQGPEGGGELRSRRTVANTNTAAPGSSLSLLARSSDRAAGRSSAVHRTSKTKATKAHDALATTRYKVLAASSASWVGCYMQLTTCLLTI